MVTKDELRRRAKGEEAKGEEVKPNIESWPAIKEEELQTAY